MNREFSQINKNNDVGIESNLNNSNVDIENINGKIEKISTQKKITKSIKDKKELHIIKNDSKKYIISNKMNSEIDNKNNDYKFKSSKKSVNLEKNDKKIEKILSNLINNNVPNTPKNPSFISLNNDRSELKTNKNTEKIFTSKHRNSVCIPNPNNSKNLNKIASSNLQVENSHLIREKLREYSSSFADQVHIIDMNLIKESSHQAGKKFIKKFFNHYQRPPQEINKFKGKNKKQTKR